MSAGRAVGKAYLVASVAGVFFFAMSVGLLGVWPRRIIDAQTAAMSPAHPLGLSDSARRGRAIYGREGCAYCHTQQIRYLHTDMTRFGAPTLAWETRFDYPHLWGTRRIGPDLSRTADTRSADWHFAHLFAPRSIVARSVMPSYQALFDGAPDRPRQEARDLLAYLESLGRAREVAGPEGEAHAREACNCADDEMLQMAFDGPVNAHPAKTRRRGGVPALPPSSNAARGQALYGDHCASCHGPTGAGDGPGAAALRPRPGNLAEHEYSDRRLAEALWHGVAGTAMPAWRDYPLTDLAALTARVRALAAPREEPALPTHLTDIGARVYAANCAQCHGVDGDGRGSAADALPMAPTNFHTQRPTLDHSLRVLRNGVDGTPMAPWSGRLGSDEMLAVAHYVRAFYEGGSR